MADGFKVHVRIASVRVYAQGAAAVGTNVSTNQFVPWNFNFNVTSISKEIDNLYQFHDVQTAFGPARAGLVIPVHSRESIQIQPTSTTPVPLVECIPTQSLFSSYCRIQVQLYWRMAADDS